MTCDKPGCNQPSRFTIVSKRGHKLELCIEHYLALYTPPQPVETSDTTLAPRAKASHPFSLGDA